MLSSASRATTRPGESIPGSRTPSVGRLEKYKLTALQAAAQSEWTLAAGALIGLAVLRAPYSGILSLLPYSGILSAVIAGACACNLYGNDGTSLWLTVLTPGATRADIRGR